MNEQTDKQTRGFSSSWIFFLPSAADNDDDDDGDDNNDGDEGGEGTGSEGKGIERGKGVEVGGLRKGWKRREERGLSEVIPTLSFNTPKKINSLTPFFCFFFFFPFMQSQPGVLFNSEMRLRLLLVVYLPCFRANLYLTLFKEKEGFVE